MSDLPDGTLLAVSALLPLLAGLGAGGVALTGVRRLRLPALILCGLAAPAWALVNAPLEGAVLFVVTQGHGLTLGDLLSAVGVGLAVLLAVDLRGGR